MDFNGFSSGLTLLAPQPGHKFLLVSNANGFSSFQGDGHATAICDEALARPWRLHAVAYPVPAMHKHLRVTS